MDVFSRKDRSRIMSLVRNRNTRPERLVRSMLHRMGVRFRLHRHELPGCPDIVLSSRKKVVFVHGCFWHCHNGCSRSNLPTTRVAFWRKKISGNQRRDGEHLKALRYLGWRALIVWECELKNPERLGRKLAKFTEID